MSPEQRLAQVQREIGLRGSLHAFVRMAFQVVEPGERFVDGKHIAELCAHLEAAYRGEVRKLAICIPPGHMKSLIVSVLFPVWVWIRDASIKFAVIGYDADLTGGRDGGKVAKLIQSPWFRARWADRVTIPTDPATSNVTTQAGGFRFASSIKGAFTGRHVHFLIVDDPIKPQDLTRANLETVQNWRQRTAPTRLLPVEEGEPGGQVYIMQRLHVDDAVGQAKRETGWCFFEMPASFNASRACRTKWGGDWRTVEGELLWPQRFTTQHVAELRRALGPRNAAAQLDQDPTPDGGLVFNSDDFKFYAVAPARFDQIAITVDAAFKDVAASDFVCIQVWGRVGGRFYLLDMIHDRMSFTATIEALKRCVRKWPKARAKLIEDKANGPAIIDTLKKKIPGLIAVNPEGGKEARANAAEPFFAAGNVFFPKPEGAITQPERQSVPEPCPWVDVLVTELINFPLHSNDDAVDSCTQLLLYFGTKASNFAAAMQKIKEQGL